MESPEAGEWVVLRTFDHGEIAHDVTTALLAMEYPASLLDLASGSFVAGIGSDTEGEDEDGPDPGPFIATPSSHRLTDIPTSLGQSESHSSLIGTESEAEVSERRSRGGPWQLLVPTEAREELEEVLDTVIEEQVEFEGNVARRRRRHRIATRTAFAVAALLFVLYLMLTFLKIL